MNKSGKSLSPWGLENLPGMILAPLLFFPFQKKNNLLYSPNLGPIFFSEEKIGMKIKENKSE
jgi:hypothetical protein